MKKRLFIRNAVILTITSLILRSIGIVFRIYVSNRIGSEGMGLYQMILSVYVLTTSFASGGLTTAVTRLCTDEIACGSQKTARKILYRGVLIGVFIGVISALGIYAFSSEIAVKAIHDTRAIASLQIMTISLPFMGASCCIKGYFMAKRKVTASSISQILEQVVRIVIILAVLEIGSINTVEGACFAVLFGDSIAEGISCLYMIVSYVIDKKFEKHTGSNISYIQKGISKQLIAIAAPITCGRYLSSFLRTIENMTVPTALTAYHHSREQALSDFGKVKGMALPLLFFPSSFLMSVAMLLIPELSQSKATGNEKELKRTVEYTIRITILSSILIGGLFLVLANDIGMLVYNDADIGSILRILAPLTPIMYLESVIVGILKGLNQQTYSLVYSIVDSVFRLMAIPLLVPTLGIHGFYIVMIISNILSCSLNTMRLCRVTNMKIPVFDWFVRPIIAILIAALPVVLLNTSGIAYSMAMAWRCVLFALVICITFGILLFQLGCVNKNDMDIFKKPIKKSAVQP